MTDFPTGTTVFAKLKGYPWWPARIEAPEDLPDNVSSKKPKQRPIWPVFFFGSYDYGWFGPSELKAFDPASAEKAKSSLKKGNALRTALSEALDPSLIAHRASTVVLEEDDDHDHDEDDAFSQEPIPRKKAAAKPKKTKADTSEKKKKGSTTDESAKRKPAKRAIAADDDDDEDDAPKPKKRASIVGRSQTESDKRSGDDDPSATDVNPNRRRSDEDAGDSGDHSRVKKKIRSGQPNERLLKLRHKLQKLLLVEGHSDEVLVQNLQRADPILAEVESFEIDLQMLKDTKIGRLMKKIAALQFSQDPHHIVDRSVRLIQTYKALMEKAQESGEGSSPTERTVDPELLAHEDSKVATLDQKPRSSTHEQPTFISNHILDIPPTPESVVAAVAAIVETNTLSQPAESQG
ncbi:hypothetical protein EMPS_07464 [Entomortierella parvispora]|uniref:PWWP domain-containing protein n=1 Tax=Entomortierella parvispora TaxID=205924 RepID=A0A9P3HEH0_9FUNG|nr:hypothetical protein EMPS_07464 [Entomortierella parvispora]